MSADVNPATGGQFGALSDDALRTELLGRLHGKPSHRWRWINYAGRTIRNPVFHSDGSAEADGEPERVALEAMVMAHRRIAARRSKAAKKAAVTTKQRRERQIQRIAEAFVRGRALPPSRRCSICGKRLDDDASIARAIGSDCWQFVLQAMERK